MEYLRCSWEDVERLVDRLYERIQPDFRPDVFIGIDSGGYMVLRMLLDRFRGSGLKRPYLPVIASKYDANGVPGDLTTYFVDNIYDLSGRILIMDDVTDTGDTAKAVKNHYLELSRNVKLATLHYKPKSIIVPDYFAETTTKWIIYPWEIRETIRNILSGTNGKTPREILHELSSARITPDELRDFFVSLEESDKLRILTLKLLQIPRAVS